MASFACMSHYITLLCTLNNLFPMGSCKNQDAYSSLISFPFVAHYIALWNNFLVWYFNVMGNFKGALFFSFFPLKMFMQNCVHNAQQNEQGLNNGLLLRLNNCFLRHCSLLCVSPCTSRYITGCTFSYRWLVSWLHDTSQRHDANPRTLQGHWLKLCTFTQRALGSPRITYPQGSNPPPPQMICG